MNIFLASPTQLRIETKYRPAIVERLKALPRRTFDDATKAWFVPLSDFALVIEQFPLASLDYDVICATDNLEQQAAERFVEGMARLGVTLAVNDAGDVVAPHLAPAHCLHEALLERSDWLRGAVVRNAKKAGSDSATAKHSTGLKELQVDWNDERQERIARAMLDGIANAADNAERKERIVEAARRRRYETPVQRKLI